MFAIDHYGVEPDIMAMAKGIASGFPLSAFIAQGSMYRRDYPDTNNKDWLKT